MEELKTQIINKQTNDLLEMFSNNHLSQKKNNTLIELLDKAGLSNKYIRALIKAKGSEKLANLKIGDKLEIDINRDQVPENIFLTSDGLNGINANFKNGLFSIGTASRQPDVLERFASVEIEDS